MNRCVLIINELQINEAKALLEEYGINYYQPGYPDGSVEVKERYPSKINLHAEMEQYAKLKGYKTVTEAIGKMGGGRAFKMKFDKEFKR